MFRVALDTHSCMRMCLHTYKKLKGEKIEKF